MLAIRAYHESRADHDRKVCLIPSSAHGTNAASAAMAGLKVVTVHSAHDGQVDLADLATKIAENPGRIAAIMVTYPSTHGVFEDTITRLCEMVHEAGGQVYIDGANMNALVGLARPGRFGGDVTHLNLHKTFAIPHGGGGPGVGPIVVADHLVEFLPNHPVVPMPDARIGAGGTVSAAPWGSAGVLAISYAYIAMMGPDGLTKATQMALLNANYIADRLSDYYPVLYTGANDLVAHECILDLRELSASTGVSVDDVAKRLIDYGFHAPTMSFPVPGTLMVEPTESEDLGELDRFCDAMIAIRAEMDKVASGAWPVDDNPLVNAPHPVSRIAPTSGHIPIRAASRPSRRDITRDPSRGRVRTSTGRRWRASTTPSVTGTCCALPPPTSCWPSNSRRDVATVVRVRTVTTVADDGPATRDRGGNLATAVSRRVTKVLQWAAHTPWAAHLWRANDRYNNRLGNQFAGGITYFSVLASVPVLMFAFSGLGLTLTVIRPALLDDVKGIVVANLYPGPMRDTVLQYLEQYLYHWQTVGLIAIVVALWAGAGGWAM